MDLKSLVERMRRGDCDNNTYFYIIWAKKRIFLVMISYDQIYFDFVQKRILLF